MVKLSTSITTVDLVSAMFPRPLGGDDNWAYRHRAYREVRKHQRRGTEFVVAAEFSDDIWTTVILGDEYWYMIPTWTLILGGAK
jgi:hypothetical protein